MARTLIIDDEANIRTMLRMALTRDGHQTAQAADGPEGLDAYADGRDWDLVLLDQRMPGMDGLEVLREIRRRRPDARVIVITAFGTIDLAIEAMKAGATDFLRKPFTLEMLRAAVDAAVKGSPATTPDNDAFRNGFTTLNGFRIQPATTSGEPSDADALHRFSVRNPSGDSANCTVRLGARAIEKVRAIASDEELAGTDHFWRRLCEQALANYIWQNAEIPEECLTVDELTTGLRRWMDACLLSNP